MRSRSIWTVLTLVVLLIDSPLAYGEGSKASVSASYTLLRDTDSERTFGRGMSFAGTHRVRRWVYVAAEVAFSADHENYSSSQGGTYDFRYQSIQAGPRASPLTGRVQPYAELLAGVTRLGIWERRLDRTGAWGSPEFSLQPGLGADVFITPRVALRLFRLNAGLAIHFGGA